MSSIDLCTLALQLIKVAHRAGRAEMEIYRTNFSVAFKSDDSPVTRADQIGEKIILEALARLAPDIPVIAEEQVGAGNIPKIGRQFFLIDPLDGTKEFVSKSDEFTINIALIENGKPVFGLIYAPARSDLFVTTGPDQALRAHLDADQSCADYAALPSTALLTRAPVGEKIQIVASKSHMTNETRSYIDKYGAAEMKTAGSSLKFCLLACGEADLYPRFGPTMEWDTAAGHAILAAAGGTIIQSNGDPLCYGKHTENFLNPFFIAAAHKSLILDCLSPTTQPQDPET